MSREVPLSIPESEFIINALREEVRLDGRGLDRIRSLKISFGDDYGYVKVQLGKTRSVGVVFILTMFSEKVADFVIV